ncbi:beta strand repeat-containing protein [Phenylobacterium montanum]|uniref:Tandem-95 repeat protein n=1 Tax=Phenylobacterium montanum TaxID=2823693 RepID=A0A975G204_9CAUL|nr:Ig-like domain-containing protein [Caulobacter sp. S6]QUD89314.1 tandem-95 repeat protein [Caulobacter sp. S6]
MQSFLYLIGSGTTTPNIAQEIAASQENLIILGGTASDPALNMSVANPNGNKLILGYTDLTEASKWEEPSLFSGTSLPSWFGNANPNWPGCYSVQYWNPAWEQVLFARINQLVSQGYNGIFLDVASGDSEWAAGNSFGNPTNTNATQQLATLITDIRGYVNSLHLATPFYIVANDPQTVALQDPAALKSLDAIFNETLYYGSTGAGGTVTPYALPSSSQDYVENVVGPAYNASGVPVLGSDYPTTSNLAQDFQSFAAYSAMGWIPSVVNAANTTSTLTSGPYMAMAVAANPTVQGSLNLVNFLSGGLVANATLIGGNQGDFFIGGPGQNTIRAGSGNDTIYAHPAAAGLKGVLSFQLAGDWLGSHSAPTLEVLVNGHVVQAPLAITQNMNASGYSWQTVTVSTAGLGPITSVELLAGGTSWTSSSNYDLLFLKSASYEGHSIPISQLTYSSGAGISSGSSVASLGVNGNATLAGSNLPASTFLANTSDVIDGGAGTNTVVYRAASTQYDIVREANGKVLVTALATAEGPDLISNIQTLQFADKSIAIASTPTAAPAYAAVAGQALSVSAASGVLAATTDYNGLTLTASLAANGGPAHGTLTLNANGSFTYTANAGYVGTDSFTYLAKDGLSAGTPITVTLNVAAGSASPPVTHAASYNDQAGHTLSVAAASGVLSTDTDPNGLAMTASLATNGGPSHGTLTLNADGSFTYTPTLGFAGTDSFTYVASDSQGSSTPTTVTLNVAAGTVATQAASYGANAGHALTVNAASGVLAGDTDPNGLAMTATLAQNGGPQHGALTLNADGSFTYTPTAGYAGTDSFTYIASDSLGSSAPTTVTLNVAAGTIATQAASYGANAGHALTVNAASGVLAGDTDPNGLAMTATLATNGGPQHGALTLNADGSFTYTPTAGYAGTDSFTYIASDGLGSSAPTTVTLNVAAQAPTTQAASYGANAGHVLTEAAAQGVLAGASDPNGLTLTAALAQNGGPQHGALVLNADGSFTYTPNAGFAGTDSFTYIASDSLGSSAPTTVTLNVAAGTIATQAGAYSAHAGRTLTVAPSSGILTHDTDPNGLAMTASLATNGGPAHGTLTLNADGSFTYTPTLGFAGSDHFTYIASDSLGSSAPTTVTLNVVDPPPTANPDTYAIAGDKAATVAAAQGVLANDVDNNGLSLTAVLAQNGGPSHGTLTLNANGSFTYTPTLGFVGTDSFTYLAQDSLSSTPTTVTLNVAAQNITGGTGGDTYHVYNSADQITVAAGTPNESVIATCDYVLPANIQNLTVNGSGLTGAGNAMNDTLTSLGGPNTLVAGTGVDTFYVNNTGDVVINTTSQQHDVIISSVSYALPTGVHSLRLITPGTTAIGNAAGGNYLTSVNGGDTLVGGAGGNDVFSVSHSNDIIQVAAGTPNETVNAWCSYTLSDNVQNLVGKTANAVTLVGNTMNNVITAGSGADTLTGGGGADTFVANIAAHATTITDFTAADRIDISAFLNSGLHPTFTDHGTYSTVDFSNGEHITLLGVHASSLSLSDHFIV